MADFTIKPERAIGLHGKMFYAGEEDELEALGFSDAQKVIKARNGVIVWEPADDAPADDAPADDAPADDAPADDAGSEVDAADGALALAAEHNIDLAAEVAGGFTGTGPGGRIYKRDVEALLD